MTISFQNHQHVLQRYCELDGEVDQLLRMRHSELEGYSNELRMLGKLAKNPDLSMDERTAIHQNVLIVRQRRLACLSSIKHLESQPTLLKDNEHVAMREAEFRRICNMRHVHSAFIDSNRQINIIVRAEYTYGNRTFDLGDWVIVFGSPKKRDSVDVVSFRRSVRPSWEFGTYPDYTLSDYHFCLGLYGQAVVKHFDRGEYLQGITLVVGVVNSINKEDIDDVPRAFYPSLPISIGVTQWPLFTNGTTMSI